jgi:hypothetical protein
MSKSAISRWNRAAFQSITPDTPRPRGRVVGGGPNMTKITYEIVEHDGGWAYRVDGVYSEAFSSHDAARRAAEQAAGEQIVPGESTSISYEDKSGHWHDEIAKGNDRPKTDVAG